MTVKGTGFTPNSVVQWNGEDRPTTFVSATTLTAAIPGSDILEVGNFPITVYDPGPPPAESNALIFHVVKELFQVWVPIVGR